MQGATPIRVVLADDHDLVRAGIGALLENHPDFEVVAHARDGEELMAVLARCAPDIVLTDVNMPRLDGLAALRQIRKLYPGVRVVVLSMNSTATAVRDAVASGASGYLLKDIRPAELAQALRSVASSGSYFSAGITQLLMQPQEAEEGQLTERQVEIVRMIAGGLSSKEIGFELGLSSKTVDAHRLRILERLGLRDVAGLTRYALRRGLVEI